MAWLHREHYLLYLTVKLEQTAKDQFWTSALYIDTLVSFSVADLNFMMTMKKQL